MWVSPIARATSMPLWIEWIQAEHEYGMTMPVVPRIDRPPTMPSRPLSVFSASAAPPGIAISTSTSPVPCAVAATSAMAAAIIWRGTGLMAGSPGGTGSPGRVTMPTPSPARKVMPLPGEALTDGHEDERAMGHVGIVARVLHDAGGRRLGVAAGDRQREGRPLAVRQRDLHRIGERAGQQRGIGRLGGRGRAGAGGPAAAKRRVVLAHGASVARSAEESDYTRGVYCDSGISPSRTAIGLSSRAEHDSTSPRVRGEVGLRSDPGEGAVSRV